MDKGRINVLHIRDSGGLYGAEQVILSLGRLIDKDRISFSIICLDRGDGNGEKLSNRAKKLGIDVALIPVKRRLDLTAIAKIKRHIIKGNIDICHSHDFKSNFYSLLASINTKVKLVTTAHGSTRDSMMKRIYLYLDENIIYKYYHKIVAVSEDIRRQLIRLNINSDKIVVIQNGIDKDLIDIFSDEGTSDSPLEIPQKGKVIGVIGRLYPDKGHLLFLEAFSKVLKMYPDITCIIVGDGPEREGIQKYIEEMRLKNAVILCGERKNMNEIYGMIDILVIPSIREGLPYTLLEAMIRKIPVVSTRVGDIPLLIKENTSGILVDPGDAYAMTKSLIQMINNPKKSKEMAELGYEIVMSGFTASKMVFKTEKMYHSLESN
ncbi:MAG: glycosyltransferase [Chitinophagaceae bacterium]